MAESLDAAAGDATQPTDSSLLPKSSSSHAIAEEGSLKTDEVVFLEFSPRLSSRSSRRSMDLSAPRKNNPEETSGERGKGVKGVEDEVT